MSLFHSPVIGEQCSPVWVHHVGCRSCPRLAGRPAASCGYLERNPEAMQPKACPRVVVLVLQAMPRRLSKSKIKLMGLTRCMSAQRRPVQACSKKEPRITISNGSVEDTNIFRSQCRKQWSGRGNLISQKFRD